MATPRTTRARDYLRGLKAPVITPKKRVTPPHEPTNLGREKMPTITNVGAPEMKPKVPTAAAPAAPKLTGKANAITRGNGLKLGLKKPPKTPATRIAKAVRPAGAEMKRMVTDKLAMSQALSSRYPGVKPKKRRPR
jgi:hypothetical protein